jgi:hypothetical protein
MLLVRCFLAGAVPTYFYALAQQAGWSWIPPGTGPYASSFGNPAFYATFLSFVFWLGCWLATVDPSRAWRVGAGAIAGCAVVFLFLAESRGPLVAWMLGLFLLASHFAASATSRVAQRRAWIVLAASLVLVMFAFVLKDSPGVQSVPGLARLAHTSGTEGSTARVRLVNASIALRAFADRPVLGWGPNTYFFLYTRFFDPKNLSNDPHLYDKVHNSWAELLCEQGLIGFLSTTVFLVYIMSLLWRARSPGDRLLLCAVSAWLIQDAFLFDLPATRLASMLLVGLIVARDPRGLSLPNGTRSWRRPIAASGIALALIHLVVLGRSLIQSVDASHVAYVLPANVSDTTATRKDLQGFLAGGSFMSREVLTEICNRPPGFDEGAPERQAFRATLLAAVRMDFDQRPDSYRLGIHLLRLASESRDPSDRTIFNSYLPRVRSIGPRRPETYFLAGERAFRDGRVDEGTRQYLIAARLDSTLAFPWWALGRELVLAGQAREGQPYVERALAQGFDARSPGGILTLIRMYHSVGDTARAREYVRVAAATVPSVLDSTISP